MTTLQQLAQSQPHWSLDEFVQVLNRLLPQFLPDQKSHNRVRELVNPRLVRYYTTQGLLDEPLKQGREARYTYRHLLQMLVVRRLMMEGYGASAINDLMLTKTNADLEALLQGGMQLTVTTANPALAFLQTVKQRHAMPPAASPQPPVASPTPALSNPAHLDSTQWTRVQILPGLELHIRHDFLYPNSPQEQTNLVQHIAQIFSTLSTNRRSSHERPPN